MTPLGIGPKTSRSLNTGANQEALTTCRHSTIVNVARMEEEPWSTLLSFGQLSLDSFIRLACVDKHLRQLCEAKAEGTAAQDLLLQAVIAASADVVNAPAHVAGSPVLHDLATDQKVAWLLKQVPGLLQDDGVMSALMQQHSMPHCMAAALLRHGAQFTWQQLQDAAASLVPGLQVWAELSRALGVQLHVSAPRIAAALCCGDVLNLQSPLQWDLPADTPPGTLSSRRSALLPELAQLAVALPRAGGATAALEGLCSLQEAAGLDSSTVAGLLKAALQMCASERVLVLMRLPAVQQLDQATALQLLQHAVDKKLTVSVQQLCGLSVLQAEYDSSQNNAVWSQLWSSALATGAPALLRSLSQLPAVRAMQLDAQALLPLLHAAVRSEQSGRLSWLCKLPAAVQTLTPANVQSLLQACMQSSDPQLPAALVAGVPAEALQQLQPANVVSLLQAALAAEQHQGGNQRFETALALPAARNIDASSACSLLQPAVLHPGAAILVEARCETAGGQVDQESISSLLAGAVAADSSRKLEALVRLPAAKRLTADALLPVAAAAARSRDARLLLVLMDLPAAAALSGTACDRLLRASVDAAGVVGGTSHAFHVNALCKIPGCTAASTDVLLAAVHSVISTSGTIVGTASQAAERLCKLLAAQQRDVPAAELAGVLQAAHSKQGCCYAWPLLDAPQAAQLQEQLVADCVQQVLRQSMRGARVGTPAARGLQALGPACTRQLLVTGLDMCNEAAAAAAAAAAAEQQTAAAAEAAHHSSSPEADLYVEFCRDTLAKAPGYYIHKLHDILKNMLACGKLLQQLLILPAVEQMPLESRLFLSRLKTCITDTKELLVENMAVLVKDMVVLRDRQAQQAQITVQLAEELLAKLHRLEDSPLYGVAASAGS